MDHGINRTEGPPLAQFPSGSTFSHINNTTVPVMEDPITCKFQSPTDSFNLAVEIFNTFTANRPDNFLPGHPLFDALLRENNIADLQALSQNLLSLSHTLPDTALREHVVFPNHVNREKCLDTVYPSLTQSNNSTHEDNIQPVSTMGCYTTETQLGTAEEVLKQIAHWSKALSSTSPSAVAAFQHALTQLAVLGLSSPSPHDSQDAKRTGNDTANVLGSNLEAINLSYNSPMEVEPITTKNGVSMTVDMATSTSAEPLSSKVESGSKVIIRQTADADEHFFKALRRLKVDVSVDTQTIDRKSSVGLVVAPDQSTLKLTKNEGLWDTADKKEATDRCEQPKISKSATELAVEEHFEKSLAAFHASNLSKQLLSDKLKTSSISNIFRLPNSAGTVCHNTFFAPTVTSGSPNYDLQHPEINRRPNMHCLVRQYAQDQSSPRQGPETFSPVEPHLSRSFTSPESETHAYCLSDQVMEKSDQVKRESRINTDSGLSVNGQTRLQQQYDSSIAANTAILSTVVASAASVHTSAAAGNSFKPKKNWLAQYDWRHDARVTCKMSADTQNGLSIDDSDSAGSSPTSSSVTVSREQSDVLTSCAFRGLLENQIGGKILQGNNAQENEVSVQTTESVGLSTEDHLLQDERGRHSAEIQADMELLPVLANSDGEENSTDEVFAEDTRPRKIILLEKNGEDGTTGRSFHEQNRCNDSPNNLSNPKPTQNKRNVKTLRKDLALSPICQEQAGNCGTTFYARSQFNDQILEDKVNNESSDQSLSKRIQVQPTPLNHSTIDINNKDDTKNNNRHNPKSYSQWGLSNSCSPSSAHQDGSATSAVTPVSGTTSGFFTGSTFSLDSSLGPTHNLPFDNREVDSETDVKSVSEEKSFADKQPSSDSNDFNEPKKDETDLPGCIWGMRKRASSEASPWSTLKRSRSILTCPLSGRVNCTSCSSSSAELLLESHGAVMLNDELTDCPHLFQRTDGNGKHRYRFDGANRSLTPELESPNSREPLPIQSRQNSDPISFDAEKDGVDNSNERMRELSPRLPQVYPMYPHHISSDRKPASEPPPVITKHSGLKNIGRSLSDAAAIPTIHLKKKNELFVLR